MINIGNARKGSLFSMFSRIGLCVVIDLNKNFFGQTGFWNPFTILTPR